MTSSQKRSWKLQEFVAHSANVTCLAIGPTSGRVMVSGGEDKKVNMWAIGKPNVILSLSGHTTPIECVQFNSSEELVCAGSQSGTLKIWDLEAAKIVRTLSGHKANIRSLDFHPYGDFVASGSIDTTVRLWDVRRKGCIVSYKGHTNAINHLRFSPDGRWVISAGEDGLVKLWDLNAGKLLADFTLHNGPVNRVEFHPREFLVATGSADRTVKFWDLETFELISSTEVEASSVRTICFHPEGLCLFSGGNDSLRAYAWEPCLCYDAQTLAWGKVSDMSFSSNQLIGASFLSTNISVWVASMTGLEEMIAKAEADAEEATITNNTVLLPMHDEIQSKKISPSRKAFNTRPKTQSGKPKPQQSIPKDNLQDDAKDVAVKDDGLDEFNKVLDDRLNNPTSNVIFKPVTTLPRSPPPPKNPPPATKEPLISNWSEIQQSKVRNDSGGDVKPSSSPKIEKSVHNHNIPSVLQGKVKSDSEVDSKPSLIMKSENSIASKPDSRPSSASKAENIPSKLSKIDVPYPLSNSPQKQVYHPPAIDQIPFEPPPATPPVERERNNDPPPPPAIYQPPAAASVPSSVSKPQTPAQQVKPVQIPPRQLPARQEPAFTPPINDKMSGLNLQEFSKVKDNIIPTANDEESTLVLLKRSHVSLCQIMVARLQNLALVSRLWFDGDIKAAVETASSMSDLSVLVDIMNVLTQKQALWTLDLCSAVLSPLKSLFSSNYESYVERASSSLKLIMKNFSPLIKSTLSTPPGALGVDLVREERYQKCEGCYRHLIEIRDVLQSRTKTPGRIGSMCKELALSLSVLD